MAKSVTLPNGFWGERGRFVSEDSTSCFSSGNLQRQRVLWPSSTTWRPNPDLRFLAYAWLKGDNLDKEDLKALRVKNPIDSEECGPKSC